MSSRPSHMSLEDRYDPSRTGLSGWLVSKIGHSSSSSSSKTSRFKHQEIEEKIETPKTPQYINNK